MYVSCLDSPSALSCLGSDANNNRSQPNIVQMTEMRETPDVMIVIPYFKRGNIVQAGISDISMRVTALGQIPRLSRFLAQPRHHAP
jgi:hypothetical protein